VKSDQIVKVSFEGPLWVLEKMVAGLRRSGEESTSSPFPGVPLAPRHVSEQQPPPPMPPMNPDYPLPGMDISDFQRPPEGPPAMMGASTPDFGEPSDNSATTPEGFDFGKLPLKPEAWVAFRDLIELWIDGFECGVDDKGEPLAQQPDRLTALKNLGESGHFIFILRWIASYKSLQQAVFAALEEIEWPKGAPGPDWYGEAEIDYAYRVAANITQVAHAAFPDLIGFFDHGTKWKRELREARNA